jgi:hypothetical protein
VSGSAQVVSGDEIWMYQHRLVLLSKDGNKH